MAKVAKPAVEIRPTSVESAKAALGELVMAWARDIETGEPRYIGEIDADHRGGKCGCECPSCRLALIAVNAAKTRSSSDPTSGTRKVHSATNARSWRPEQRPCAFSQKKASLSFHDAACLQLQRG